MHKAVIVPFIIYLMILPLWAAMTGEEAFQLAKSIWGPYAQVGVVKHEGGVFFRVGCYIQNGFFLRAQGATFTEGFFVVAEGRSWEEAFSKVSLVFNGMHNSFPVNNPTLPPVWICYDGKVLVAN